MSLKIGVIGSGKIARIRHLPEILVNPQAEVGAVCDNLETRANEMAKKYNCKAYTDYRDLLMASELDAVIIAAPNIYHADMSVAALQAGKHVLCEKPMATTLVDAQRMMDAAQTSQKQLMIGHNQRLEPAHVKAKEIIQSGKLGKVLSFTAVFGHPGCEYWAIDGEKTWFFKKELAGMGVLGDLAVHKLDLLRFLLDDDYVDAVALMDTLNKTYPNGGLINVEDNATCLLRTQKGALGTVITSWTYQVENNSATIYGEKGVLQIYSNPDFPLAFHYDHQTGEYYRLGKKSTNVEQVKSGIIDVFVDAVVSGSPVPIPGIEGYKALEAVIACQEAARTGQNIQISSGTSTFSHANQ